QIERSCFSAWRRIRHRSRWYLLLWVLAPLGAAGGQQRLERAGRAGAGLRIAHQARGVDEREADPLTVVRELRAVEIGAAVALLHRDPRGAGERVHPVAEVLRSEEH